MNPHSPVLIDSCPEYDPKKCHTKKIDLLAISFPFFAIYLDSVRESFGFGTRLYLSRELGPNVGIMVQVFRVDEIDFSLEEAQPGTSPLSLMWKKGEMFLTLHGLLFSDRESWFLIRLRELKGIEVVGEAPLTLRLCIGDLTMHVTGENALRLRALRSFLLPHLDLQETGSYDRALIRFLDAGIRDLPTLERLLGETDEQINTRISQLINDGYLGPDQDVTEKGLATLNDTDRSALDAVRRMDAGA